METQSNKTTPIGLKKDIDPYSRPSIIELEKGASGAARMRRIPLTFPAASAIASGTMLRYSLNNAATTTLIAETVVLPADYVRGGFPSLNILYNNSTATGDVMWVTTAESRHEGEIGTVVLLDNSAGNVITVPSSIGLMAIITQQLTLPPTPDSAISALIQRLGSDAADTTTGNVSVWTAWISYLAFF